MRHRSLLFVPADRPERFAKAAASGADAIILDLQYSVSFATKAAARKAVAEYLAMITLVRVKPLDGPMTEAVVAATAVVSPDSIMLPKAEAAATRCLVAEPLRSRRAATANSANRRRDACGDLHARRISRRQVASAWSDLSGRRVACCGSSRHADGSYTAPYEVTRALTLFAAHGAGVAAIDNFLSGDQE